MLHGFEHTVLDSISCIAEGPVAIAISRGGAKKTYHHRDPNEDACGFASNRQGTLLVLADGHAGADAAQFAVERVIEHHAEALLGDRSGEHGAAWAARAFELVADVHGEILRRADVVSDHPTRTTLTLAVTRGAEDWLGWLTVGDSLCFRAMSPAAQTLPSPDRIRYLGSPRDDRDSLAQAVAAGTSTLAGVRAIVLATDGLSETGIGVDVPANAVDEAVGVAGAAPSADLRPLTAARRLAEIANTAHKEHSAGDNIATAVAWLND